MARQGIHGWGALAAGLGQGFSGGFGREQELQLKMMLMQKKAEREEASRRRLATEDDARQAQQAEQASRLGYASRLGEDMQGSPKVLAAYRDELLHQMSRAPSLDLTTPPNLNLSPAAQAQNVQGMTEAYRKDRQLQSLLAGQATPKPPASFFPGERPVSFKDAMKEALSTAVTVKKGLGGIGGELRPADMKKAKVQIAAYIMGMLKRQLTPLEKSSIDSLDEGSLNTEP